MCRIWTYRYGGKNIPKTGNGISKSMEARKGDPCIEKERKSQMECYVHERGGRRNGVGKINQSLVWKELGYLLIFQSWGKYPSCLFPTVF